MSLVRSFDPDSPDRAGCARDIVVLAITLHSAGPRASLPWQLWTQSFSFYRLAGELDLSSLSIAEFRVEAADSYSDEARLLEVLSSAWSSWNDPLVVTAQGASILLPALRVRSLIRNVALPAVHAFEPIRAETSNRTGRLRTAHFDVIADLQLPRARPPLRLPVLFDDLGLAFSATFDQGRHDPRAAAQILATATLMLFLRRCSHTGVVRQQKATELAASARETFADVRGPTPWLHPLVRDFEP